MWFDEFKELDEIFEQVSRALKSGKVGEPLYYGFSVSIGPSGVPEVETFGNIQPTETGEVLARAREPFSDVIVDEKNSEVIVTAEIPGTAEEDIEINAAENSIEIKAETKDKKYYKSLPLAVEIDPNSANTKYNNGILEIKARLKKSKPKGVEIKID